MYKERTQTQRDRDREGTQRERAAKRGLAAKRLHQLVQLREASHTQRGRLEVKGGT